MLPILLYLCALLAVLVLSLLTALLLHEAGHALAALLLAPGPVTVFVGSHGHTVGNFSWRVGRLQFHLKRNVLRWSGGFCQFNGQELASWRRIVIIMAGPLTPLLTGIAALWLGFSLDVGLLKALAILFLLFAVSHDLRTNLVASHKPVQLADGRQTFNDGFQLKPQALQQHLNSLAEQATRFFNDGRYVESAECFEILLAQSVPTAYVFRCAVETRLLAGDYDKALALSVQCEQKFTEEFTDDYRFTQALLLSRLGRHPEALAAYSALIEQPKPYPMAYNNRGYTYNLLGEHELAIADFDRAIAADSSVAYAYNNRGLAQLRLGQETAGLADIAHGLALDPTNAYGYRNQGIYHLERDEYAAALSFFEQARQLDPTTHLVDEYLRQAREQQPLNSAPPSPASE